MFHEGGIGNSVRREYLTLILVTCNLRSPSVSPSLETLSKTSSTHKKIGLSVDILGV